MGISIHFLFFGNLHEVSIFEIKLKLISFDIFWIFKNFYKIFRGFLFSLIDFVLRIGVQRHPFWIYNNFRVLLLRFIEMYVCHCYFLIDFY